MVRYVHTIVHAALKDALRVSWAAGSCCVVASSLPTVEISDSSSAQRCSRHQRGLFIGRLRVGGELAFDPAATPLARAAAWMLERYETGELTIEHASDPERVYPITDVEQRRQRFGVFRRPISQVLAYEEVDGVLARIRVTDDRDRAMVIRVWQHPEHPGRVWRSSMMLDPAGVTVRLAVAEDADALRSLELATPVQHEGFDISYDRPDPFAQDRLRSLPVFRSVAEIGGAMVGTHADACHVLDIDGLAAPVVYRHHARILPAHQGAGVFPAINGFQSEQIPRDGVDRGPFSFGAIGNTKAAALLSGGSGGQVELQWATPVVRYTLDCTELAGGTELRAGSSADVTHVSSLLRQANQRCVLWPGGGAAWLERRMNQSSDDYGWHDLVVDEHAIIGVWDAGWSIVRTSEAGTTRQRVATILDWGFDPDRPDALEEALRATCTRALGSGVTHLLAFCGPPAPGHEVFDALAAERESFKVGLPFAEPPDTALRGIYVDPVYF